MSDSGGRHRVEITVAIIGLVGTITAAVIANWDKIFPPASMGSAGAVSLSSPDPGVEPLQPPPVQAGFSGTYSGYSREGSSSYSVRIEAHRQGDRVTGAYIQAGERGSFQGVITGGELHYAWSLGGLYGRGVTVMQGSEMVGSWGYGDSADNGGTLRVAPQ